MRFFAILLVLACLSVAHQPRIVSENLTLIQYPEVSQAFYGELNGSPAYFEIESDAPFTLYAGITVPALEGVKKDKSALITMVSGDGAEKEVLFLNASGEWTPFHEEFANDDYFQGPEGRVNASAGTYVIKVFSPDNSGKYALAVGEEESFGPMDTLNAVVLLPKLKGWFFGKSPFEALFTLVYLFAFLPVLAALALVALLWWAVGRWKGRKGAGQGARKRKQPADRGVVPGRHGADHIIKFIVG